MTTENETDFWDDWSAGFAERIRRVERVMRQYHWFPTEAPRTPEQAEPIVDLDEVREWWRE